jgi:hypothetical protein
VDSDSGGAADCTIVIRIGDTQYVENGLTKDAAELIGDAELSACEDTGDNARVPTSLTFPRSSEQLCVGGPGTARAVAEPLRSEDDPYGFLVGATHRRVRVRHPAAQGAFDAGRATRRVRTPHRSRTKPGGALRYSPESPWEPHASGIRAAPGK